MITARSQVCELVWSLRVRGYTRAVLVGRKYVKLDGKKMGFEEAIDYLHKKIDELSGFVIVCAGGSYTRQS